MLINIILKKHLSSFKTLNLKNKKSPKVGALRLLNKVTLKEALCLFFTIQIYNTSFILPKFLTKKINCIQINAERRNYDLILGTYILVFVSKTSSNKPMHKGFVRFIQ
jgi:hypothetical protein